jgi:hypothetical protein
MNGCASLRVCPSVCTLHPRNDRLNFYHNSLLIGLQTGYIPSTHSILITLRTTKEYKWTDVKYEFFELHSWKVSCWFHAPTIFTAETWTLYLIILTSGIQRNIVPWKSTDVLEEPSFLSSGDMLLRQVDCLSTEYKALHPRRTLQYYRCRKLKTYIYSYCCARRLCGSKTQHWDRAQD